MVQVATRQAKISQLPEQSRARYLLEVGQLQPKFEITVTNRQCECGGDQMS